MHPATLRVILAATDLTERSDAVLRGAAALAALARAQLHVLHAVEFQALPYTDLQSSTPLVQEWVGSAQRSLQEQIRRAIPTGAARVSWEVVIHAPHLAILERADMLGADLIVLGPHREQLFGDRILGTTADRVIRTARVPCLILREPLSLPLRQVVVPIDLSAPARGALDLGLQWARLLGARDAAVGLPRTELRIIHITPEIVTRQGFSLERAVVGPKLTEEIRSAVERAGGASEVEVREEVVWGGRPTQEIVRYAREEKADLLVMGTHGYGAIRRVLIGSVASAVARRTPCPLLLVPPTLWQTTPEQASPAERPGLTPRSPRPQAGEGEPSEARASQGGGLPEPAPLATQ